MVTRSCLGADPAAEQGAPPHPHSPGFHSLQRKRALRSPLLRAQARGPAPSGAPAGCPPPCGGAGCPRRPHRRLALAPSFQLRQPERAHRGSRTWARGRRRPLLPEPKPEQGRSPSMLREPEPRPLSAHPLSLQAGEAAEGNRTVTPVAQRAEATGVLSEGRLHPRSRQPGWVACP